MNLKFVIRAFDNCVSYFIGIEIFSKGTLLKLAKNAHNHFLVLCKWKQSWIRSLAIRAKNIFFFCAIIFNKEIKVMKDTKYFLCNFLLSSFLSFLEICLR